MRTCCRTAHTVTTGIHYRTRFDRVVGYRSLEFISHSQRPLVEIFLDNLKSEHINTPIYTSSKNRSVRLVSCRKAIAV